MVKQKRKKRVKVQMLQKIIKKKFIFPFIILFFIVLGSLFYITTHEKRQYTPIKTNSVRINPPKEITPIPIPPLADELPLQEGRIAYIKDGNVFLLEPQGKKQITQDGNKTGIKWSKDGQYLGWINRANMKFWSDIYRDTVDRDVGISISVYDVHAGTIRDLVVKTPKAELSGYDIEGFDFSPDGQKIAYTYDGVWILDITNGQEEKLFENKAVVPYGSAGVAVYGLVDWNKKYPIILLQEGHYEASNYFIYDFNTRQLTKLPYPSQWSQDGEYIVSLGDGRVVLGIWIMNIRTGETVQLLGNEHEKAKGAKKNHTWIISHECCNV